MRLVTTELTTTLVLVTAVALHLLKSYRLKARSVMAGQFLHRKYTYMYIHCVYATVVDQCAVVDNMLILDSHTQRTMQSCLCVFSPQPRVLSEERSYFFAQSSP